MNSQTKFYMGLFLMALACSRQTVTTPLAEDLNGLRLLGVAPKPPVPEVVAIGAAAKSAVLWVYAAVPSGQEATLQGATANGNLKFDPAAMQIAAPTYEEHAGFRLATFLVTVPIPTQASFKGAAANAAGTTQATDTATAAAATPASPASLVDTANGSGTSTDTKPTSTNTTASTATAAKSSDATAAATPAAGTSAGTTATAAANAAGTSAAAKTLAAVSGTIGYSFTLTSGPRTDTAVGDVHVAGTGSTDLAITAPTINVSSPAKNGTMPSGGGPLNLDYTLASQEGVTVGWFVSDGEVKNRRDALTNWVPGRGANHTAIGTVRTNRTFGFALQVVDVDTE